MDRFELDNKLMAEIFNKQVVDVLKWAYDLFLINIY